LGLLSFDEEGIITTCNDNFVKIIGSSKEKLIGLNMLNLPDKNIKYSVQKALNGLPAFYEGEYSSVTANKITPVRCLFTPVKSGSILRGMGIVEDITERKSIENKILKLNLELEQLVKERTIELENTNTNLHKEIEDRTKYEDLIKQQLQEREVLLKEIHHRVKNNIQIIISILNLQASFIKNKKMIGILQDSQTRIKTMALVHEKLYQAQDFSNINFREYITNLLEYLFASYRSPNQEVEFQINTDSIPIEMDSIISLGLITNELVSNSFKYAFAGESNGQIEVSLQKYNKENIEFCVSDNGAGFPPDIDYRNTESLGLQLVCILAEQIHGKLDVQTSDKGTTFSIIFPVR
jgi:PAS domain S-box-containing protein